jgi:hypothetical protein
MFAVTVVALFSSACGGKKTAPKAVAGVPAEAFAPLTEDDVARFVKALPAVVEYLSWRGNASGEGLHARDDAAKLLATNIEPIQKTEGIDSVLAANGADWPFFRAMLYRLSACAWEVGLEGGDEQEQRLIRSQPTKAMASAQRNRLKQMKDIAAAVPAANVEVFKRHYRELRSFMSIVGSD